MKILHYFLGFPPYRSGGLTKYAFDMMKTQAESGDLVCALWPGKIRVFSDKVQISRKKDVLGICNYELINPLPIPLDEGINDFSRYEKEIDPDVYESFLRSMKPDIIHIHTLMGLHKEFFAVTKKLKIKTIFTTHDYFGLCPKITFFRFGSVCDDDKNCSRCIDCNLNALSINKIRIMQSTIYRILKNSFLVTYLRRNHRQKFQNDELAFEQSEYNENHVLCKKYKELRQNYIDMMKQIDIIHFNSTISESIYKKFIGSQKSKVLSLSHKEIADNRSQLRSITSDKLRITYLAAAKAYKGYHVLIDALNEICEEDNHKFILNLYTPVPTRYPYMNIHKYGYKQSDFKDIFENTDVLVVPSIWYETFGFTVLEALSYGVPVIVSNHVGAMDIVKNGGLIAEAGNKQSLIDAVKSLNEQKLNELKQNILKDVDIKTWKQLVKQNYDLYDL